jgi:FkbM family methyltransferase
VRLQPRRLVTKLRSWQDRLSLYRDQRDLRLFQRTIVPRDFPNLRFLSPTRALSEELRLGPDREPETRQWIEAISDPESAVLWDVGANIGHYTVFAAKRGLRVVAIEPMPHNLMLLVHNIGLNAIEDRVTVLPMAIAQQTSPSRMQLSSVRFGSARHKFGGPLLEGGDNATESELSFELCGVSINEASALLRLPPPTHLKVDIDGLDDEAVFGASEVLSGVQGVCCEVRFDRVRVDKLITFLARHGLRVTFESKRNILFSR